MNSSADETRAPLDSSSPIDEGGAGAVGVGKRSGRPWRLVGRRELLAIAVGLAMGAVLFVVPMPYVVDSPGPTFDVAGSYRGTPLLSVAGADPRTGRPVETDEVHEKGDGKGELRMVTVSEAGGPGARLSLVRLVGALFDSKAKITPYSQVYPDSATKEQIETAQSSMMRSSQRTSEVAALESLGWTVPATVTIRGATSDSSAGDLVKDGDVLKSATLEDGSVHPIDSASTVFALVKTLPVGSRVRLAVTRDGKEVEIPVTTISGGEGAKGSRLGLYLDVAAKLPVDVSFNLESVGGPSAGLMFSLGIIDRLTPGPLTGGAVVAGTGTMSYDGEVGAIGGIVQKMNGAKRDGAQWFLAPASNCAQIVGNKPQGLRVVAVTTLDEARRALDAIASGEADSLPTCEAATK